ncbi:hypothetical protein BAL199_25852 [alpha proteobacterium BAL199]|nr:hypothetical protein BAL199_25852 [alpha proteobacterium BAL199]
MTISRRQLLRWLVGTGVFGFSGAAYAFGVEPRFRLAVQRHEVRPATWPRGMKLRIAAIADPHLGEPYMPLDRYSEIVETANAQNPDLIVLLGDYGAEHSLITRRVPMVDFARASAQLSAPLGVYAILGNHDWWDDPDAQHAGHGPVRVQRHLEDQGIRVLHNDAVRLDNGGKPFWLLGLGDQLALLAHYDREQSGVHDLAATLAHLDGDDAPALLLAHEPDIFPQVPDRVALTLCGHTHGGQVRMFGYSPIVPSGFGNRYAYGHIIEEERHLVVSGGLGCSNLPIRLGVPPEITLVDLA